MDLGASTQQYGGLHARLDLQETRSTELQYEHARVATPTSERDAVKAPDALRRVLQTTELLEAILMYFDLKDLFSACAISKVFNNTVANSINLRRKMFLQAATRQHVELLPSSVLPGLPNILDRVHNGSWSSVVRVLFRFDMRAKRVRLGVKVRSMQLSRCPVVLLRAYPLCCPGEWNGEDLIAPEGITLGMLYDKALQITSEHEACQNRIEELKIGLSKDPYAVHPFWAVEFASHWFELSESHPLRVQERANNAIVQPLQQRLVETSTPWLGLWQGIDTAKVQAAQAQQPLSTWPQFLKANMHVAPLHPPSTCTSAKDPELL